MFAWFNAKEAIEFGESLALFFAERIPPESKLDGKGLSNKIEKALDEVKLRVVAFRKTHSLNIYKRAQLGNAFKWKLHESGFDSELVDELTKIVVLQTSRPISGPSK